MDMQKIKDAAAAIKADVMPDFAGLAGRDRKSLEAIALELGMEPNDANLAHIASALVAKNISLAENYPKMKYRKSSVKGWESVIVDSADEEAALPADGDPWTDTPPLPNAA